MWQQHNQFSKRLAYLLLHLSVVFTGRLTQLNREHSLRVEKSQLFSTTTVLENTVGFLQLAQFVVLMRLAI
jgi:hypothetical protein